MKPILINSLFALGALALAASGSAFADHGRYPTRMGQTHPWMTGGGMGMMGPGMMGPGTMMGGGMMGPGMMPGGMGMQAMHGLDLDQEQVQKMTQIHRELATKHAGMIADMQQQHWQLRQELAKDRPDPETVGKLYGRMFEMRRQMIQDRVKAMNRLRDTLTEEQREQFREMMDDRYRGHPGMGYPSWMGE